MFAILHEWQKASGRMDAQGLWPESRAVKLLDVPDSRTCGACGLLLMETGRPEERVGPETTISSSRFQRLALCRVWWLTPVISVLGGLEKVDYHKFEV